MAEFELFSGFEVCDAKARKQISKNKINEIRKKYNNKYEQIKLPDEFNNKFFKRVNIYFNGEKYVTDFDVATLKNKNSTHTYYVSPNGSDENDGLTRETPFFSLQKAYQYAVSRDTIILLEGVYTRHSGLNLPNPSIKRSINIIGEGRVILTQCDDLNWIENAKHENVYQAERTSIYEVIDFSNIDNNSTNKLIQVASIEECANTENTYYYDGTTIYVHMFNNKVPSLENLDCALITGDAPLKFDEQTENLNIYLENITILDGYGANLLARSYNEYTCTVIAKNCRFFNSLKNSNNYDAVCLQGADGIFQNCIASFSGKDGFNYHALNQVIPYGIEINCQGSYNGLKNSDNAYNGSTAHDGAKVLRIGGVYHDNKGPNVADVQDGTTSINYSCVSYDSRATDNSNNSDFFATQGTAKIYINKCYSKDSNSKNNLFTANGGIIYNNDSEYDTKVGSVIDIE